MLKITKVIKGKGLIWLGFALIAGYFLLVFLNVEFIITPDSTGYLQIAKNISSGLGVVNTDGKVVTHWGFCYPLLLGIVKLLFCVRVEISVFIVHILLTVLIFFEIRKNLNFVFIEKYNSIIFFFLFYLLVYLNGLLLYGASVMTEYLYFYFSIVLINLLFNKSGFNGFQYVKIGFLGLLAAFLFYTRYIGVSLLATVLFYFLINRKNYQSIRIWFKSIFLFITVVMSIYIVWHIYLNLSSHGYSEFNRVFKYHPVDISKIKEGIDVLFHLFFLKGIIHNYLIKGLVLLLIFSLLSFYYLKRLNAAIFGLRSFEIVDFCFSYVTVYSSIIIITLLFFDASTPLDLRIFTPIIYFIFVLLIFYIIDRYSLTNRRLIWLLAILLFVALYNHGNRYFRLYRFGEGLNSIEYKNHEALKDLKQIVMHQNKKYFTVYTNGMDYMKVCYKYGDVKIKSLPLKYYPTSGSRNPQYQVEMSRIIQSINSNDSVCLLYFNNLKWRKYLPTNREVIHFSKELKTTVNIKFQYDSSFILYPK